MQPVISVIMPCFNYGRYLRDAVNSLVGGPTCLGDVPPQTFQQFEIIIINDASTDDTDAVARALVNERIKYISNEKNLGTAATLNVGIRQAAGQVITYLSTDDMMEQSRLERLYTILAQNNHRMVYDDIRIFDGRIRTETWPMADYDFDRILYKNLVHAGIMYPKVAWAEAGGYPEAFNDGREDWAFNVALGVKGWCGIHLREPLYLYRREGQNRSNKTTGAQWRMAFMGKMQATFPNLYQGDRPTMCCGNKRSSAKTASVGGTSKLGGTQQFNIGEDGMVLLEYQLPKAGHVQYIGAVTRQVYVFSSLRKRGYVDSRDAPALLARIEDRRHAFIQVNEPKPRVVTPPLATMETATEPANSAQRPIEPLRDLVEIAEVLAVSTVESQVIRPRKPRKSA